MGLTQQRLGDAIGVSKGAVSRWESDQDQPQMSLLAPISRELRVSLDHLVCGRPMVREEAGSYVAKLSPELMKILDMARNWSPERLRALLLLLDG